MPNEGRSQKEQAGVWSLVSGGVAVVERWDLGPAIALVPAEAVLLLPVELPLAGLRERRAALPFAVEDRIADPLDAVHVVVGAALGAQTYLAAVVRHDVMAGWVAALAVAGLGHARIVPDALVLPVPPAGAWHVAAAGGRVLVRTDTGIAFAAPAARFAALWAAAGSLPCTLFGPPLPPDLPPDLPLAASEPAPGAAALTDALDLRDGPYAAPAPPLSRTVRRAAAIVAVGLLAHTALLAADAHALGTLAAARRDRAETLLRQALPGAPLGGDLDRLLPGSRRDRLLPLLARAAAALAPVGGLAWSKLAWSEADGSLTLGVEAHDIGGLQRAQAALAGAGLAPVGGAVTAGQDRADGDITIRAGA